MHYHACHYTCNRVHSYRSKAHKCVIVFSPMALLIVSSSSALYFGPGSRTWQQVAISVIVGIKRRLNMYLHIWVSLLRRETPDPTPGYVGGRVEICESRLREEDSAAERVGSDRRPTCSGES